MDKQEHMDFIFEIFSASMPRLGPGDDVSTKKALAMLLAARSPGQDAARSPKLRILDVGCGNGAQTIQLAKKTSGTILAVDVHRPFLEELQRRAGAAGVAGKIKTCQKDMCDLGRDEGLFDLIWSEGSLFIMGFRTGLAACHALLATGGQLAASELTWLKSDAPPECRRFFAGVYPAMTDVGSNLAAIRACGYKTVGHFSLPESAWWDSYYNPLAERLPALRALHAADPEKLEMLASVEMEIDIYSKYSNYYGYVFYLMNSC